MAELFKPWSKGNTTAIVNSDAVFTAEGMPVCRMIDPLVPNAAELILLAPQLHQLLNEMIQAVMLGNDPAEKDKDGVSLLMRANGVLRQLPNVR